MVTNMMKLHIFVFKLILNHLHMIVTYWYLFTDNVQVTEIKREWLAEIAPHYYQSTEIEDCKISVLISLVYSTYFFLFH